MRILIVEDDETLRELLLKALQKTLPLAEIDTADTADEIISFMNTQVHNPNFHYTLIISDVKLAGDNTGFDLWKMTEAHYPNTLFLFISGLSVVEFLEQFKAGLKCPPFLSKPFSLQEFEAIIQSLLEGEGL